MHVFGAFVFISLRAIVGYKRTNNYNGLDRNYIAGPLISLYKHLCRGFIHDIHGNTNSE